jgi:hypothetical protein
LGEKIAAHSQLTLATRNWQLATYPATASPITPAIFKGPTDKKPPAPKNNKKYA